MVYEDHDNVNLRRLANVWKTTKHDFDLYYAW